VLYGILVVLLIAAMLSGGVISFVVALKTRRAIRAGQEVGEEDGCVACGSPDIDEIGPRVWRCRRCGFTGGPGMADLQRVQRMAAVANMSPQERHRTALEDLQQAHGLVVKAGASLSQAGSLAARDCFSMPGSPGDDVYDPQADSFKQGLLVAAVGDIQQAEQLMTDAAAKLRIDALRVPPLRIDLSSMAFALDGSIDNVSADRAVAGEISRVRQHATNLASLLERTLSQIPRTQTGAP